jgi:hypothetical protein
VRPRMCQWNRGLLAQLGDEWVRASNDGWWWWGLVAAALRCAAQVIEHGLKPARAVSRPFPSWNRPILTEIYLCHACSCQEILRAETAGQDPRDSVTRNKATEVVKYILDRRGELRQRPRLPPMKLAPMDGTTFLGKLGAVEQPLGTTIQELQKAAKPR